MTARKVDFLRAKKSSSRTDLSGSAEKKKKKKNTKTPELFAKLESLRDRWKGSILRKRRVVAGFLFSRKNKRSQAQANARYYTVY